MVIENRIALAQVDSDYTEQLLEGVEEIYCSVMGEMLYVIQCTVVPVPPRKTDRCYQQIPVSHNNEFYYLTLNMWILSLKCIAALPVLHKLGDHWIGRSEGSFHANAPKMLNPNEGVCTVDL